MVNLRNDGMRAAKLVLDEELARLADPRGSAIAEAYGVLEKARRTRSRVPRS